MSGLNGLVKSCLWCFAALAMCCGLLLSSGCGCGSKKAPPPLPEVYTNRVNDMAYIESLLQWHERQKEVGKAQQQIRIAITQHVARVRAAYPQGIGEDALQEKLAADAEWQRLVAQEREQQELAQKVHEAGYNAVQARKFAEIQAEKDVRAGKAKALDKPRERVARLKEDSDFSD